MAAGGAGREFLEHLPGPPRRRRLPRRQFVFGLVPGLVLLLAALLLAWAGGRGRAVPKPGPRRYPPGYRAPPTRH